MYYFRKKIELSEFILNLLDKASGVWSKLPSMAGGVARYSTYLFPLRSPGFDPPFRGFGLSTGNLSITPGNIATIHVGMLIISGTYARSARLLPGLIEKLLSSA
jgi:hypothetical protein